MRSLLRFAVTSLLVLVVCAGCAFEQRKVEKQLRDPSAVNCATAQGDIRMLQGEKANVLQRIAEGATAIYPAGLVVGLATGTEGTKFQVAAGDYNDMIDRRIAEIKSDCGL